MKIKNTANPDCGCDPYLLSLVETPQGQQPVAKQPGRSMGILLASITGGAAIALSVVCFPFVSPALRRVIYCHSSEKISIILSVFCIFIGSASICSSKHTTSWKCHESSFEKQQWREEIDWSWQWRWSNSKIACYIILYSSYISVILHWPL